VNRTECQSQPYQPNVMQEPLPLSRSCEVSASLLERVSQLQGALAEIERSLQEKHLKCCLFPELGGVEEITKALIELSARRIGALIAIERNMSLEDVIKSGTLINAELSASLLLSLFYPGSPLHDGAVIIRNEKIIAGGCILPLSADHNTFKALGLGTRHRAGVGLTQVSDAAVFIVSEHTGRVSLALAGQMFHEPLLKKKPVPLTLAISGSDSR
jgi:diadenylate cyclase